MNQFHFMHPLWLLALLPLAGLLWLLYQYKSGSSSQVWDKVIDANLLPFLLSGNDTKASRSLFYLLAAGWLITVVALADPVWQKIPRPIFQTNAARVIVLDLSRSMLVPDLKPSRLARARFKIEDILSRKEEGQTGLVVFAGDAFTASPLTRDADTIRSLLQVLTPDIMPAQGSRADLGLAKAHDLLKQANINKGQVLLIADGVVGDLASKQARVLKQGGFTVSVLGVGTKKGGVIPNFRMVNGVPIIAKLDEKALQAVAKAGGGAYHTISNSNSDLQMLLNPLRSDALAQANDNKKQHQGLDEKSQDWKSSGPYFVLLLIPLAALAFRRGWLFSIFLLVGISGMMVTPQPAMAFSFSDLWQRPDQQADKALQHKDFKKASQLAQDPLRRGSAEYKQGKFEQALQSFSEAKGADAAYNRGNTLAQLKKYQDAIKAYEEALQQDPTNQDAKANKEAIEKLLK
jgi:Ca-activated chloride channel family protein